MEIKSILLEVPRIRSYNYCMMNKKEELFYYTQIQESVSCLYWDIRDSLDDEGGQRLKEECEHFEKVLLGIIKKHEVSE